MGWTSVRYMAAEPGQQGILAPLPTGDADTDTGQILEAVALSIDRYGDDGSPVFLRGGRYVFNDTVTPSPAGGLLGAIAGGRLGVGYKYGTTIDATAVEGAAVRLDGAGQVVSGIFFDGPLSATSSREAGTRAIDATAAFSPVVRDVFIVGFANQIVASTSQHASIQNTIGYNFTTHGLVAVGASNMAVRDSPLSNPGPAEGVIEAHNAANYLLDGAAGVVIDHALWDETPCNLWIVGASRQITIAGKTFFSGNVADSVGMMLGDGTNPVTELVIRGFDIRPFQHFALSTTRGIVINEGVSAVLQDITVHESDDDPSLGWYEAGNGIVDNAPESTIYRDVRYGSNGPAINTVTQKAGAPSDADWTTPPPIGTQVVDTTNNRLYTRTAVATWKYAALT